MIIAKFSIVGVFSVVKTTLFNHGQDDDESRQGRQACYEIYEEDEEVSHLSWCAENSIPM